MTIHNKFIKYLQENKINPNKVISGKFESAKDITNNYEKQGSICNTFRYEIGDKVIHIKTSNHGLNYDSIYFFIDNELKSYKNFSSQVKKYLAN